MKFHTLKTFTQYGWKQWYTVLGYIFFALFLFEFHTDLITLIHNVLKDPTLITEIVSGLGSLIMILINLHKDNDK